MSKYDALGDYLRKQAFAEVAMTFADIERVTGVSLPPKAQHHRAWWSNNPSNNVMTKVWLAAGYQTEQVDMAGRKLVFRRTAPRGPGASGVGAQQPPSTGGGMSDGARNFEGKRDMKTHRRHPAFGALKGTFTIEPGWDLTKPALDPEELAEWEESLDRKADMIERGMREKKG